MNLRSKATLHLELEAALVSWEGEGGACRDDLQLLQEKELGDVVRWIDMGVGNGAAVDCWRAGMAFSSDSATAQGPGLFAESRPGQS